MIPLRAEKPPQKGGGGGGIRRRQALSLATMPGIPTTTYTAMELWWPTLGAGAGSDSGVGVHKTIWPENSLLACRWSLAFWRCRVLRRLGP